LQFILFLKSMPNLRTEFCLRFILLISFVAIISALFVEHFLGHQPCNLCLIERIPYGLTIILIIFNFIIKINDKFLISSLIIIFIFSILISFYHLGIEEGFFQESAICGIKDSGSLISKEEILKQMSEKAVSCKDVTFKIFGLSLTSINIIISLLVVIMLIKILISNEKNR
tara:strand:- start:576 stop:1088 length:513 start_codon:yes stop_codon:yes gene_type:complete